MAQTIPGALIYESGRSNSDARAFFSGMPLDVGQINPDYIVLFDDFTMLHGKALNATDMYDVVKDAGAAVAVQDVLGGVARITSTATTDNDGGLIQCTANSLARTSGKKLWFEARVKVSDADQGEMFVGLAEQAAADPEAVIAATIHRMGFELVDGSAVLNFSNCDGTANSLTSTGVSMSDDTFIKVGFYYDGTTISVYVDRVLKLSGLVPGPASGSGLMTPAFFHLSGDNAGTHTAEIDYYMVILER